MDTGLSAADIIAMTRDGVGNGNGNGAWDNPFIYLVWLALLGNGGLWGNRGNTDGATGSSVGAVGRYNCVPSCGDLFEGFNNQDVNGQLRGITQGLCDGFYAVNTGLLQGFNGTNTTMLQGFNGANVATLQGVNAIQSDLCKGFGGVNTAISNLGFQMQQCCCDTDKAISTLGYNNQAGFNALGTQIAQCCCDMKYDMASQFCDTRNTIQNTTRDIIDNQNANTRSILDFMIQTKLADKDAQIAELQRAASQDRQNAYLTTAMTQQTAQLINAINPPAVPAYVVPNPNACSTFSSCGCNSCY